MNFFEKNYEIVENAPKEMTWENYYSKAMQKYSCLLEESGDSEKEFQEFFEKNPAFIPGALGINHFGGHNPYMDALISQPELGTVVRRKPDFLWLAQNSLKFTPVFIEIERPNKRMFAKDGHPNQEFNQALNQIDEWRGLLKDAVNIQTFYKMFSIPSDIQEKEFEPQFILVYGRRNEYENDNHLRRVRASKERENVHIMSFDRLAAVFEYKQFVSCKVQQGKYKVLYIPPTFRYQADSVDTLAKYEDFENAIDHMEETSVERKQFLHERFPYWISKNDDIWKGMIISGEGE